MKIAAMEKERREWQEQEAEFERRAALLQQLETPVRVVTD